MKNTILWISLAVTILMTPSCKQDKGTLISPKIQYDVSIKSPDPNYDWWIQNIEGPQRERLISTILNGALSGKFDTYNYFYQPISKEKVAQILNDTIIKKIRDVNPPYELKDTLIINKITVKDIQKLRFMETWRMNEKTLDFEKKVMGVAPVAKITDASGIIRWQPLFWIFTDKNFVKTLHRNQIKDAQ